MPTFTVTVNGQEYDVDAPNEEYAGKAVAQMMKSAQPSETVVSQAPIESGTLLPTPLEGGGKPSAQQPIEPQPPEQSGEVAQIAGGALRGGATIGTGALIGLGLGGPPGALAGAGAMALTGPIISGINQTFGTNYTKPDEAMQHLLTYLGVPKAEMSSAKLTQAMTGAIAETAAGTGIGKALLSGATPNSLRAIIGESLASQPGQQMMGSAGAAAGTQLAEQAGAGVPGQLLAGLGGGMLGSFLGAARTLGKAAVPKGLRETEQAGISPLTSQTFPPETPLENALAKARELTFFGTGSLLRGQEKQRAAAVQSLVEDFGANLPGTDYLPELTKQLTDRRRNIVNKFSAMKTDVIDKLSASGGPPNVDRTLQTVEDEIKRLRKISDVGYDKAIAELESFGLDIMGKDLKNLEARRKLLGLQFKSPELATVSEEGDKSVRKIYDVLREDMGDFIKTEGGTTDYTRWKIGNKNLSDMADELRDGTLKKILNTGDVTPENVQKLLFSQNKSSIKRLYDNLDSNGRATARAAIIRKAIDRAGGLEEFTPNRFLTQIKKLQDEVGIMFNADQQRQVDGLTKALQFTKRAGEFAANPPTGAQFVPFGVGAAMERMFGPVGTAAAVVASTGGVRLYESKPVRELLLKLPSVKAGSPEEYSVMKRLGDVLKAQEAKVSAEPKQESK
jgi:hypothetical protein